MKESIEQVVASDDNDIIAASLHIEIRLKRGTVKSEVEKAVHEAIRRLLISLVSVPNGWSSSARNINVSEFIENVTIGCDTTREGEVS